ncbi:MAG: carboxyl transferase domain-containing protein, partial [Kurthia sp.]
MAIRDLFSGNRKKKTMIQDGQEKAFPEGLMTKCSECRHIQLTKELEKHYKVCVKCGHHFKMTARERVAIFLDEGSFVSMDDHLQTSNPLNFPAYVEKVSADQQKTGLNEAVLTGVGTLDGEEIVVAIMDSHFRMGSMGSVVGEKITRAVEKATKLRVPFII